MPKNRESTLEITAVTEFRDAVVVHFTDGHRAFFYPYTHGVGYQVEGLRHFYLFRDDTQVVWYNSRLHRSGPGADEHKLERAAEYCTPERIAEYWAAARTYIDNEFDKCHPDTAEYNKWWYPWRVVCGEGWHDLEMLQRGQAQRV